MKKALTLSIVIPVYNEEERLRACLVAIANQTETPDEVIVVDNNSQDGSVAVAKSFDFVRVIVEKRQGVLYAARTGFDAAHSDIICRIDADSHLPDNWLATVRDFFLGQPDAAAVTGDCYFYDFPLRHAFHTVHHAVYYSLQKLVARTEVLWGSNMAIRRTAWEEVKADCLWRSDIHEDIDLSLHLHAHGLKIERWPALMADVSLRRGDFGPLSIVRYLWPWPKTYWANKRRVQAVAISLVLMVVWLVVLPVSLLVQFARLLGFK